MSTFRLDKLFTPQSASQPYTSSSMYYQIWGRVCLGQSPNAYGDTLDNNRPHESWWYNAVNAPDQLRHGGGHAEKVRQARQAD